MFYSNNPVADFDAWDAHQSKQLAKLPECADCGEPIQDETAYYINCVWICPECIEAYRREITTE